MEPSLDTLESDLLSLGCCFLFCEAGSGESWGSRLRFSGERQGQKQLRGCEGACEITHGGRRLLRGLQSSCKT